MSCLCVLFLVWFLFCPVLSFIFPFRKGCFLDPPLQCLGFFRVVLPRFALPCLALPWVGLPFPDLFGMLDKVVSLLYFILESYGPRTMKPRFILILFCSLQPCVYFHVSHFFADIRTKVRSIGSCGRHSINGICEGTWPHTILIWSASALPGRERMLGTRTLDFRNCGNFHSGRATQDFRMPNTCEIAVLVTLILIVTGIVVLIIAIGGATTCVRLSLGDHLMYDIQSNQIHSNNDGNSDSISNGNGDWQQS